MRFPSKSNEIPINFNEILINLIQNPNTCVQISNTLARPCVASGGQTFVSRRDAIIRQ